VCGAALHHAARTADDPKLRTEAKQLAAHFPSCQGDVARTTLARVRHNRLNHRYRRAHTWAEVLLRSGGVADLFLPQELVGDSHLLIMHVLWERLVHRMVGSEKIDAVHVKRPGARNEPFKPDAVARSASARLAIDAKYKDYDNRSVSPADIHQLLTYASAYRVPGDVLRAVIVHPSTRETEQRDIKITFSGKQLAAIDLIGVDVSKRPEHNSIVLKGLLDR
jgi:5-methylcytosine-specific restriction enzyme subunit McrC